MQLPLDPRRRLKDLEEFGVFLGRDREVANRVLLGTLSVCQPSSCQADKKTQKVKSSELQEDLPAMCTQDIYEEDAELDCDLPAFWF